jgi:LysR family transcriptional regulator, hypochlorite-specific transcription factor HypT
MGELIGQVFSRMSMIFMHASPVAVPLSSFLCWGLTNAHSVFFHAFQAPAAVNFLWLDDFLALASSGNFSRAADERHMTQPAFSRRIRALEEWLGVELFDRSTQPARLTEAGEWFRGSAEELRARVARIPGEAQAAADASAATLRLAATHALSFTFLPTWLRSLEAHTAVGPVRLMSDVLQRCEAQLLAGQVQFALCHAHAAAPGALDAAGCASIKVGEDVLVPVCAGSESASRAPSPRYNLDLKRKAQDKATPVPIVGYSAESGVGRILQAVHGESINQVGARTVFTAHLASVLKTMALDGRGVAWLPASLIQEELQSGRLQAAGAKAWQVPLDIRLYRALPPLGKAAENFWHAAETAAPKPLR